MFLIAFPPTQMNQKETPTGSLYDLHEKLLLIEKTKLINHGVGGHSHFVGNSSPCDENDDIDEAVFGFFVENICKFMAFVNHDVSVLRDKFSKAEKQFRADQIVGHVHHVFKIVERFQGKELKLVQINLDPMFEYLFRLFELHLFDSVQVSRLIDVWDYYMFSSETL